ncbi:carboxyl transferase domain-containing protein [soil metagenome]
MRSLNPFHWRRSTTEFDEVDLKLRDRCVECDASLVADSTYSSLRVCEACRKHYLIPASLRVKSLVDEKSFKETNRDLVSADPLTFDDSKPYAATLAELSAALRLSDALVTGAATLHGHHIVLAVIDFRFMGGSMGVVVGEKLARAAEHAAKHHRPLITVVSSGGARMQEGMFSLLQMAKTASAVEQMKRNGSLYVSVLTSPTTGGVFASFASLGDVVVAEPGALIGFAGPRVVEELLGLPLPPESHSAEFLFEHGLVDAIVDRAGLREHIATLLEVMAPRTKEPDQTVIAPKRDDHKAASVPAWEIVQKARIESRPTTLDYISAIVDPFVELHGDRQGGDDPAVIAGLGRIAGFPVAIAGFERGHGEDQASRRCGRPMPHGYRKIQRIMRLAAQVRVPLVSFIDTPGAYPGIESERSGLASEIARTLAIASTLKTPTVAIVIGEGGSGGALALAVADRVFIQETAFFSVIAPEGAAAILYREGSKAAELAEALKITPAELLALGLVDDVIPESPDGKTLDLEYAGNQIRHVLGRALDELSKKKPAKLIEDRSRRYRSVGANYVKSLTPRRESQRASKPEQTVVVKSG